MFLFAICYKNWICVLHKRYFKTVKFTKNHWISSKGIHHQNADLHGKPEASKHSAYKKKKSYIF